MEITFLIIAAAAILAFVAFKLEDKHTVLKVMALFFVFYLLIVFGKAAIDGARNCQLLPVYDSENYVYGSNFTDTEGSQHWHDNSQVYIYAPTDNTPRIYLFNHNTTYNYIEVCQDNTSEVNTALTFYKVLLWFFRLTIVYTIGFLSWLVGQYLIKVNEGRKP